MKSNSTIDVTWAAGDAIQIGYRCCNVVAQQEVYVEEKGLQFEVSQHDECTNVERASKWKAEHVQQCILGVQDALVGVISRVLEK